MRPPPDVCSRLISPRNPNSSVKRLHILPACETEFTWLLLITPGAKVGRLCFHRHLFLWTLSASRVSINPLGLVFLLRWQFHYMTILTWPTVINLIRPCENDQHLCGLCIKFRVYRTYQLNYRQSGGRACS